MIQNGYLDRWLDDLRLKHNYSFNDFIISTNRKKSTHSFSPVEFQMTMLIMLCINDTFDLSQCLNYNFNTIARHYVMKTISNELRFI